MKASEGQISRGLNPGEDLQEEEEAGKVDLADTWRRMGKRVTAGQDPWVRFRGEWKVQKGVQSRELGRERLDPKNRDTAEARPRPSRDILTSWNGLGQNLEGDAKEGTEAARGEVARTLDSDPGQGADLLKGLRSTRGSRGGQNLQHQRKPRH